ncbi:MAG: hypothetical protein SNJ57_12620 [Cyanobacteriota bacterium]
MQVVKRSGKGAIKQASIHIHTGVEMDAVVMVPLEPFPQPLA